MFDRPSFPAECYNIGNMAQDEIERLVRHVGQRMLLTCVAETAGVCATAGAIAGAALVAAWAIGRVLPGWAIAICLSPIIFGLAALLPACRRLMRLSGRQATGVFIVSIMLAAACAAAVLTDAFTTISRWAGFAICLAGGACFGAAMEFVGGSKPLASAIEVDLRAGLKEKFATAAELALSDGEPDAIQACVFDQAADAAKKAGLEHMGLWHRTRATVAAVVLSCCLAAALGLLPVMGLTDANDQAGRTAAALLNLPNSDANRVIDALNNQARQDPTQASQTISAAAREIAVRDKQQLAELIARLEKMGYKLAEMLPVDIQQQIAEQSSGGGGTGGQTTKHPSATESTSQVAPPSLTKTNFFVPVPLESVKTVAAVPTQPQTVAANRLPAYTNFNDAWSGARQRAANLLTAGKIPPEYRQLVRDFFDAAE